jgi:hypothetical protein
MAEHNKRGFAAVSLVGASIEASVSKAIVVPIKGFSGALGRLRASRRPVSNGVA